MHTQLDLSQFVPNLRPEPLEYLDDTQSWGSFTIMSSRQGQPLKSISRPLCELQKTIDECIDDDKNYWISQASFNRFNRQKVNLHSVGVNFVDLDFYNIPRLAFLDPQEVLLNHIFPCLKKNGIPYPSLVIDSGKGLQIKWYTERLPARVLPRWDRLQTELCSILEPLGADKSAKDVSRILRLVTTVNQKTNKEVRVIWSDIDKELLPVKIEFNKLCNAVLPFTQEKVAEFKAKQRAYGTKFKAKKSSKSDIVSILSNPNARTVETLNWNRMHDLKKIVEIRGGIQDGLREIMAFYLCNFYALRYAQSNKQDMTVWHEFYQLCTLVAPHWKRDYAIAKVNNVFKLMKEQASGKMKKWNGKDVPMLYVPKNDTIINLFEITDDEQSELVTIISKKEKQRRNTESHKTARANKGKKLRAEYLGSAKERLKTVLKLTSEGLTRKQIAENMGISSDAVKSLKRRALQADL